MFVLGMLGERQPQLRMTMLGLGLGFSIHRCAMHGARIVVAVGDCG
jgi:hypothetical protein